MQKLLFKKESRKGTAKIELRKGIWLMRLGKYLSELTKPELEGLKEQCCFTETEIAIFDRLKKGETSIEISEKISLSVPTIDRRIRGIKEKIERCDYMDKKIPIWEKMNLTIEEAAEYSNIGINKLNELAKSPMCTFVLYIGKKKLIKRKEFEKFIEKSLEL